MINSSSGDVNIFFNFVVFYKSKNVPKVFHGVCVKIVLDESFTEFFVLYQYNRL